jgi:phosphinothricin acetyltransferase
VLIEDASEHDLPEIVAIVNEVIAVSTAIFSETPVTLEQQRAWLGARREKGFPVLVARDGDAVAAFASYGEFRPWPGYSTTVEHSVHVAAPFRRKGLGRALVGRLVDHARASELHVMVAGIDADNAASLALHEQLGFTEVGRMREIAHKFDRWVDLVLLALWL